MAIDTATLNIAPFNGYGAKISRKISITGSKSFGFPPAFYEDNDLKNQGAIELFFDEINNVIGIKFVGSYEKNKNFAIVKHNSGQKMSATVSARSFFNYYKINTDLVKGRYLPQVFEHPEHGKMFLIQLAERNE